MLGTYFYHEILRKTVIAFGTLFNDIIVQRKDNSGNVVQDIKVPLAYAPREKALAGRSASRKLNRGSQQCKAVRSG